MRTHVAAMLTCLWALSAQAGVDVAVTYLRVEVPAPPTLSNLEPVPDDLGLAGATTGLEENATTGRFTGQSYTLEVVSVPEGGDYAAAARAALAASRLLLVDAPAEALLGIADLPEAKGALIFDVAGQQTRLRDADCRANVLHTAVSFAMRADALVQFFVLRRWTNLVMVAGTHPDDLAFAEALTRSAAKFGLKVRQTKTWAYDADMRRSASAEVPLFTQDFGDYDVLIVADEAHDFGHYILYNTWEPRPVAGSEGLAPVGWSPVMEQWGAAQLQSRFREGAGRDMAPRDYAAWAAMRTIGEAVTRTGSADPQDLRAYILGPEFELGGFKGRPMTYRPWNGQLRQPVALVHPRAMVAQAPLEGFLHQVNELDTLGIDRPESNCAAFGE